MARIISRPGIPALSIRQYELLLWLVQGVTMERIGELMGIKTETAQRYASTLYRKLGVKNRKEAVDKWLEAQLWAG